jgi:hypothetical protein
MNIIYPYHSFSKYSFIFYIFFIFVKFLGDVMGKPARSIFVIWVTTFVTMLGVGFIAPIMARCLETYSNYIKHSIIITYDIV